MIETSTSSSSLSISTPDNGIAIANLGSQTSSRALGVSSYRSPLPRQTVQYRAIQSKPSSANVPLEEEGRNVFLSDLSDHESALMPYPTIPKQPIWADAVVDSADSRYFHFFLCHMSNILIYGDLFPKAINEIFARTLQSKPLRHIVLCMSSGFIDGYLQRPVTRSLTHKQEAFSSLRECLSSGKITEDVAIAICLMLFMDIFSGKTIPQAHLRGLYLVLKELHIDSSNNSPLFWNKVSPILMLIWRLALKIDGIISTIQQDVPIFPPFPAEFNVLQRQWALSLAKDSQSADWALASFALDNLYHRSLHWAWEGGIMRNSESYLNDPRVRGEYEKMVRRRVAQLNAETTDWLKQPAVAFALQLENLKQHGEIPSNINTFLDYPPVHIHDRHFTLLLNQWRAQYLFVSFVAMPLELRRHTRTQLTHAIDICRTHAALALSPTSKEYSTELFVVLTAGHTFVGGKRFQREYKWVHDRIAQMYEMQHPLLSQMSHFMEMVKDFGRRSNDWDEFDEDEQEQEQEDWGNIIA